MGSSRFPGKPLAPILGRPMIEHVYRRVKQSKRLDEVYIATCDREIEAAAKAFGAPVIMTSDRHERCSERIAEAAESVQADVYVKVQGDEPMVTPQMVDASLDKMFSQPGIQCVNLMAKIKTEQEFRSPNTVKVVVSQDMRALYFSREAVPSTVYRPFGKQTAFKQVCVIPFTRESLLKYARLPMGPLEIAESCDMLRFLENGIDIHMAEIELEMQAVDTPDDLKRVERLLSAQPDYQQYFA